VELVVSEILTGVTSCTNNTVAVAACAGLARLETEIVTCVSFTTEAGAV
jgi:hypothetical protein